MPSRPISPNLNPNSISTSSHESTNKTIFLAITLSATALIVLTIIYVLYHVWRTLFRRSKTNPFDSSAPLRLHTFTYRELKSATNGFSLENSIGKGASGTVFRGILRDGKSVAVKKLDVCSLQADREFQNELTILGGIESPFIVDLLGYCVEKKQRLLVYEYMPNHSLQELLFADGRNNDECLSWERRFRIIQDVAKGIKFLHHGCDPPVIHGDVKPSNVLLDWDFRAKVSDFGLSRHKVQLGQFGMEIFSQDLAKSQELLSGNLTAKTLKNEKGFAHKPQASCSYKTNKSAFNDREVINSLNHDVKANDECPSPRGKEMVSPLREHVGGGEGPKQSFSCDEEPWSIEHSKELELSPSAVLVDETGNHKQWESKWWWRQEEESGELYTKDYVSEWIGSQICQPEASLDWEDDDDKMKDVSGIPPQVPQSGPVLDDGLEQSDREAATSRPKKMQEWWKEEQQDEMSRKGSRRKTLESRIKKRQCFRKFLTMPHVHLGQRFHVLKRRFKLKGQSRQNVGDKDAELSFRRVWKRTKSCSVGSEMWSGDLFSRELSSTTSMRGTLCYVAPEYGGCDYFLMEKADIYSLGVLFLVILSGRRPLHVLNSPMKLEKANLISWCRQLVQAGNVLELVDERIRDAYDKEQANMCINVALACLQRMPELRPDIVDVVKILQGEKDLPSLPNELSPSPTSKLLSRSRRKLKCDMKP